MRFSSIARASSALALSALLGCTPALGPTSPKSSSAFHVVAEGPCQKLAPARFAERTLVLFGETGYSLSDWEANEPWPAAQSIVELREGEFGSSEELLRGLPKDDRGYVPFDLRVGRDANSKPWLRLTDTHYAARGTGALVRRTYRDYQWNETRWVPDEGAIDLGGKLKGFALDEPCEDAKLTFVPLDHAVGRDGSVFIAGRCQDADIVAYEDTTLVVAVASPKDTAFSYARLPRTSHLSGMVNIDVEVDRKDRAWLVAYEPFSAPEGRHSYFVVWDGARFEEVDLGVDKGLMSVAHTDDGRLFVAASSALLEVDASFVARPIELPAPRFATGTPEVHLHTVTALGGADVWVQGTYRVTEPRGPSGEPVVRDASVLYSTVEAHGTLYCEAAEPRTRATSVVEGEP